jgi:hypothetical protein
MDSRKHQDQPIQERSSSENITTDVELNTNNDPEEEEEKECEILITTDKNQELAPKHVK